MPVTREEAERMVDSGTRRDWHALLIVAAIVIAISYLR
jgi:hypothetical protein